jgi:hypothetical protein
VTETLRGQPRSGVSNSNKIFLKISCAWDLGNELDGVGPFICAGCGRAHDCKGSSAELVSDLVVLENSIFSPVD